MKQLWKRKKIDARDVRPGMALVTWADKVNWLVLGVRLHPGTIEPVQVEVSHLDDDREHSFFFEEDALVSVIIIDGSDGLGLISGTWQESILWEPSRWERKKRVESAEEARLRIEQARCVEEFWEELEQA